MFTKILIANRGEIAVRIIHACREMSIHTIALYTLSDQTSLHVRLADECVMLSSPSDFMNPEVVLQIAQDKGADAIHPGIGFLAENKSFVHACENAGIRFIGPPAVVMDMVQDRPTVLQKVRDAGIPTVMATTQSFDKEEMGAISEAATDLGYPVIIKAFEGGRGSGERLVFRPENLEEAVRSAHVESVAVYGSRRVYLEKAILNAHQVAVQVIADQHGNLIHLGEREGSIIFGNRKVIDESPAPCLNQEQRERLWHAALYIAGLFGYQNVGSVEFLVDDDGNFYFTEFKARIQTDHPVTEWVANFDLVQEQIRIAAGLPLSVRQDEVRLQGYAMQCRINAEDPDNHFLPSPGKLRRVRIPGGNHVRVDTYVYCDAHVPPDYSRLFAKLSVWAPTRQACLLRLKRALEDFLLIGTNNNVALIRRILETPDFIEGRYHTRFNVRSFDPEAIPDTYLRDLAIAAAVLYIRRNQMFNPSRPERLSSGWHRDIRRLPQ